MALVQQLRRAVCCQARYSSTRARVCRSCGYQWSGALYFLLRYSKMATLEERRGVDNIPWLLVSHLGLGLRCLVPEFLHSCLTQPGDPFKHRGNGSSPLLGFPWGPSFLQERSEPFSIPYHLPSLLRWLACFIPAVLAAALQPVPANGLTSQPSPLFFQLEHTSHKPGTSVRAVPTHLPPPHTASFSFMSHLESLTPTSNLSRFYTPPVALLCPSLQKGAQIMIRASSRVRWRPGANVYSADGN